jgi:hypothetical protein
MNILFLCKKNKHAIYNDDIIEWKYIRCFTPKGNFIESGITLDICLEMVLWNPYKILNHSKCTCFWKAREANDDSVI